MAADERVAARAALRVGFVIGDVVVTSHARGAVCPYLGLVNAVAGFALGMTFALRNIRDSMKARKLGGFVTTIARGLRRHRAAVRLVAGRALPMSFGTLGELFIVTASTGDDAGWLMSCPLVTCVAAGMTQVSPSQTSLERVASAAKAPVA